MKHLLVTGLVALLVLSVAGMSYAQGAVQLKVGDLAPNFMLKASDGKTYTLADFKGKRAVVVAWFPRAFTQGCTIECKSLAENGAEIRKFDVAYFMASVDSLEQQTAFAKATSVKLGENMVEKKEADFPLLADPDKQVATAYGVLSERGTASRWTFYIGKDGKILAIDKEVKPATSAADMVTKLKELGVAAASGASQ